MDEKFAAYIEWRKEFAKTATNGYDMFDVWQARQPEIDALQSRIAQLEQERAQIRDTTLEEVALSFDRTDNGYGEWCTAYIRRDLRAMKSAA